jgi:hypothetical protein
MNQQACCMKSGSIESKQGIDDQVKNRVNGRILTVIERTEMIYQIYPSEIQYIRLFQQHPLVVPTPLKIIEESWKKYGNDNNN